MVHKISTAPRVPSTLTRSPVLIVSIASGSVLSTIGMSDIMAPTATIGSADLFIIAAGAVPFFFNWYITYDPTVEPFPEGNTRTFPFTSLPSSSCPFSTTTPVSGSILPRNEMDWLVTSASPSASPLEIGLPVKVLIAILSCQAFVNMCNPGPYTTKVRDILEGFTRICQYTSETVCGR